MRRFPFPLALSLVTAILVSGVASGADAEFRWPFGKTDPGNRTSMEKGLDLYNLGLIGAKAWDPARGEPVRRMQTGRRAMESASASDPTGPTSLRVMALFEKGPGHRAGLRLDDVIVGVGGVPFTDGFKEPLADALVSAESASRGGVVLLDIERGGEPTQLEVKIPKGGKDSADPVGPKSRKKALDAALKWLAEKQGGDGGYPETLSGSNGAVVMTSLAGLAWIAGGSHLSGGRYKSNIKAAYEFVLRGLKEKSPFGSLAGDVNWDQTTWGHGHAAVFLGELCAAKKSSKVRKELQWIVTELCQRQEQTGGYGHGPGGKNGLGYIELNIMAGFVLAGIGLGEQAGCEVDRGVVERLLAYCEASAGNGNGVGYSTVGGHVGHGNIGRTAGTWLGALTLGLRQEPWPRRMQEYVREHAADVEGGHASLMQHIMFGGLGAAALGEQEFDAWWQASAVEFTLARAPDGSIQPRPWRETIGGNDSNNTDVSVGDVWTTASWAIVLGARPIDRRGGLKGWCALEER